MDEKKNVVTPENRKRFEKEVTVIKYNIANLVSSIDRQKQEVNKKLDSINEKKERLRFLEARVLLYQRELDKPEWEI